LGYLEEAELTVSLIKNANITKKCTLLEIGGGLGFAYGFLKKLGFNIYAIEPSISGFSEHYKTALTMFNILKIDHSTWYPFTATECQKLGKQFDIIFSNNVLEHIPNLKATFLSLRYILKSDGVMIHNTVNYFIPYEPHFNILLVPFFPKFTTLLKPALKTSPLWRELNFITTKSLKSLCKICKLNITFRKGILLETFLRFGSNIEFAERQRYFFYAYLFLKWSNLIKILNFIPMSLTTPICMEIRKNN
jgi:2-polyprenyl-3-methyl-5-hydroxy-6-metoxy-1,4-benzoquinol methylase